MKFGKFNMPAALQTHKDSNDSKMKQQLGNHEIDDDSLSIHSRLLDKLQLGDDEWDYDEGNINTSISSVKTVHTVRSQKKSTSQITNSKPANQFRSLKTVVVDSTSDRTKKPTVISRALEDEDVTINSVNQNKSIYVTQRHQVKSIHLDDLLQDNESSLALDDDDDDETIDELLPSDIFQTPTKEILDLTPTGGSPSTSLQATPKIKMAHDSMVYSPVRHPHHVEGNHYHNDSLNSNSSAATAPLQGNAKDSKIDTLDSLMRSSSLPSNNNNGNYKPPKALFPNQHDQRTKYGNSHHQQYNQYPQQSQPHQQQYNRHQQQSAAQPFSRHPYDPRVNHTPQSSPQMKQQMYYYNPHYQQQQQQPQQQYNYNYPPQFVQHHQHQQQQHQPVYPRHYQQGQYPPQQSSLPPAQSNGYYQGHKHTNSQQRRRQQEQFTKHIIYDEVDPNVFPR